MAMVVSRVIEEAHEGEIVSLAYNTMRKEIYSAADGDKVIKVWDSRTGHLLRTQQGHKGMVTCLLFSNTIRLLFSGSIDSTIGIWTEKGVNLQMTSVGGTVFSIAWDDRRKYLIVGGHSVINIFKVDLSEARKLSQQQRSVASGLKDGVGDSPQILRRVYQPLRGPDLCHSDVVKCIVVTETGKIMSGGFDKAICIYEFDKLDKPKEAFAIKRKCHTAAIVSMAYDHNNNCVLTGSIDGSMKVWSVEGRPLDHFENINDQPVCVAYVPPTHMYWASGRFGRLQAYDPRAPSNVTEYVRDANGLDRFKVTQLFTPLGSDLLLGGTKQRQLVIWQHDKTAAYRMFRKHEGWVEALVVVDGSMAQRRAALEADQARDFMANLAGQMAGNNPITPPTKHRPCKDGEGGPFTAGASSSKRWVASEDQGEEPAADLAPEIFSASADGKVLRWQLDADENCDIYECVEEIPLHNKNIHCITYSADLDCIITGGEDSTIRLHYLSGTTRTFNDVPLPTSFQDHEGRVTGLALLKNNLLASTSFDRTLRVWDLTTMKPVSCVANAHDTPIQCLEYNKDNDELATCGMGNKVRVWDAKRPSAIKQKLTLNHADHDQDESDDEDGGRGKRSNMNWLTRSDIAGLPKASNPLVDDTIKKASQDTPEVTQVRWAAWRNAWVTAADDDMIRVWNAEGVRQQIFSYSGGSCQALYADMHNKLLVATMLDKTCCVYDLDDPLPLATFSGHTDVIRAVSFLPTTGCYVTASWDKSLRLWFCPTGGRADKDQGKDGASSKDHTGLVDEDEDEEHYISEYERLHPLEVPRALTEANQWQILKAIGVVDDDKAAGKKGRARAFKVEEAMDDPVHDSPGTLGGKLNDLGKELLNEINAMARQRKSAMEMLEGGSHAGSDKPQAGRLRAGRQR